MKQTKTPRIAIIGGGIAGLTSAIALRNAGLEPMVFESAPEIKALGAGLVLAANAVKGLQRIGIADKVIPLGKPLSKFSILTDRGHVLSEGDSSHLNRAFGWSNFAIHRADLHRVLLEELKDVDILSGKKALRTTQDAGQVTIHFQDDTRYSADYVIVADGVHSALRQQLIPGSAPRYAGYTCWRAVVPNPGLELSSAMEIWGAAGRIGIVPLQNNQIYWFICANARQNDPAMKAMKVADLLRRFQSYHDPVRQLLEAGADATLLWNDIIDIQPIRKYAFDRILLTGDAAHATTPNMGQGACQAIEDAAVLLDIWEHFPEEDPMSLFRRFEQRRVPRNTMIVERSWQLGKIAQLDNPFLVALRNGLLPLAPKRMNERQIKTLFEVDF